MFDAEPPGTLGKFAETMRVFAERRPSVRDLLRSRTGSLDRVHAVLPSTVAVGESLGLTVQVWDEYERLHGAYDGDLRVSATDDNATYPDRVSLAGDDEGYVRLADAVSFETPGVHYLTFSRPGFDERYVSNPVSVSADPPDERVYWGDIHLHSRLSDGTGSLRKGYRFGRDAMDLDVVAYTDHDTMGFFIPPSLQRALMHGWYFDRSRRVAERFNDPGEFVTLVGYEWTKQPNCGGHVNVYFEDADDAVLLDSRGGTTDTYEKLWSRLREFESTRDSRVVTIPHHPTERMYPFDFSAVEYDDELAPLVEVYSQWGSGELPGDEGNPFPLAMGRGEADEPGHFVRDALSMGHRVGLVAGADYHGPHPGHSLIHADPHLPSLREWVDDGVGWSSIWRVWNERSYPGGLSAFRAPELTREAVFESLRSRRVYGTTQPHRILASLSVGGVEPGENDSSLRLDARDEPRKVEVEVAGTAPLERVEVVKNGETWRSHAITSDPDAPLSAYTATVSWTDDDPVEGTVWDDDRRSAADAYYLRVTQVPRDCEFPGTAWAGPVWVEPPD
ncbi:DUF3604 domain-containing protein [Haloferax sulfurifontis]|uniref:DUF3604 domain-containing protein n=1 Tax=Haloferax sulfurifontis TaxID=255616 RepID=A0A830DNR0_9EURY|nr:DUF3604 domain-containing protein [Haloferax sulfurifontis]GGC46692.1 hypothetical protein GCM10007209_05410 [Haloferax sulfurifontis]